MKEADREGDTHSELATAAFLKVTDARWFLMSCPSPTFRTLYVARPSAGTSATNHTYNNTNNNN
jgi:hypothetical protein